MDPDLPVETRLLFATSLCRGSWQGDRDFARGQLCAPAEGCVQGEDGQPLIPQGCPPGRNALWKWATGARTWRPCRAWRAGRRCLMLPSPPRGSER